MAGPYLHTERKDFAMYLSDFVDYAQQNRGGTLSLDHPNEMLTKGFVVGLVGTEARMIDLRWLDVADYLDNHWIANEPGLALGVWFDTAQGLWVLDMCRVHATLSQALAAGVIHKQRAVYDLESKKTIFLTVPDLTV